MLNPEVPSGPLGWRRMDTWVSVGFNIWGVLRNQGNTCECTNDWGNISEWKREWEKSEWMKGWLKGYQINERKREGIKWMKEWVTE